MDNFLAASEYIDFDADNIQALASELLSDGMSDIEKSRVAFEFVRDEIPHSFDCGATVITARASDVLKHRTGICHAKANLLAALGGINRVFIPASPQKSPPSHSSAVPNTRSISGKESMRSPTWQP